MESAFHSDGHKRGRDQRARTGAPQRRGQGGSIHASPLRSSSVALSSVSSVSYQLINHHKQRHMLTKKSKVITCLTIGLETGAEPIHTCLNRTSHLQRSPLLPTVASRSFGWRPLGSLTSRRPPVRPAEHHGLGLVRRGRRLGRGPAPSKQHSRCGRTGRKRPPGTCSARRATTAAARSHWLSPRPSLAVDLVKSEPFLLIANQARAPTLPVAIPPPPRTWVRCDTDTVLADSPSFPPFRAPYPDRTFRPASSRCTGILTRISPDSTRVGRMLTDAGAAPRHRPHNPSSPGWAVPALESRPTTISQASPSRWLI